MHILTLVAAVASDGESWEVSGACLLMMSVMMGGVGSDAVVVPSPGASRGMCGGLHGQLPGHRPVSAGSNTGRSDLHDAALLSDCSAFLNPPRLFLCLQSPHQHLSETAAE